jgi:hypothetical protein
VTCAKTTDLDRATRRLAPRASAVARSRYRRPAARLLAAAGIAGAAIFLEVLPAQAQRLDPKDCLKPGEPLFRMPELVSSGGKLKGTIALRDELRRLNNTNAVECAEIYLRFFEGLDAVYPPTLPDGVQAVPQSGRYKDPVPGPTLRAQVGDIVQLTFLNQIDYLNHSKSIVRGGDFACDQFPVSTGVPGVTPAGPGYPQTARDTFPNCFHGSNTANIHFHGTHTNPNTTGDNVFLQILPSPQVNGQPIITEKSVTASFDRFFAECEAQLRKDVLAEWPRVWNELPHHWRLEQERLLKSQDSGKPPEEQLWPENQRQIRADRWPQYFVGAFPYCFQLPEHTGPRLLPGSGRLRMGQAPGLHWYHAHKHGSTALNVANGMTGAFVIEGKYDDELNKFYGTVGTAAKAVPWMRAQPVLVLNQLGGNPNLAVSSQVGPQGFSVNGRRQPRLQMRPGEVQLWRIVNTSSRTFARFLAPTDGFHWRQLAQDGVQCELLGE